MKTYDYIVTLKKGKYSAAVNWISQLLVLLSLVFLVIQFNLLGGFSKEILVFGSLHFKTSLFIFIILSGWIYLIIQAQKKEEVNYRNLLFIASISWMIIPGLLWICFVYVIAGWLEKPVKLNPEFGFSENEIVLNDFPVKRYEWNEFNNIVLKDGLLTLDFTNNKIYQKEIESEYSSAEEKEFNDFCNTQLKTVIA